MNISLAQQYQYLNWRRQISQLHRQMVLESKAQSISHIHSYIVAGIDPRTNPDISALYYSLIDENLQKMFEAEIENYVLKGKQLIREEDVYKNPASSLSTDVV